MHPLPPVILLDLDDTILRFSAVADECWSHACATFVPRLQGVDPAVLMASIKQHAQWYWSDAERSRRGRLDLVTARRLIVRGAVSDFQAGADQIADALADAYGVMRDELVQPFPGAIETLDELHRRGVHMALVTNGAAADQRRKVERFHLQPFFEAIFIEGELGYGKPDLRVFRLALERLGTTPADAWMIGNDLELDIAPAATLEIAAIWVDHTGGGLPPASPVWPTRTVTALAEIL